MKNIIGVLLLAVAIGLISRVIPGEITLLLVGLLGAGVALFLRALEFNQKTPGERFAQLLGLFLLVYALACWYGALSGQTDPLRPLGRFAPLCPTTGRGQSCRPMANHHHPD